MTCEDPVQFDSPQWKYYSRSCIDLISKLLIKKPEQRITLEQMLQHPWFSKMYDREAGGKAGGLSAQQQKRQQ